MPVNCANNDHRTAARTWRVVTPGYMGFPAFQAIQPEPAMPQATDIFLRRAVAADLPRILEVEQLSFVHAGERFDPDRIAYLIINPRSIVTVAMRGEQLLGWAAGIVWLRGREPWGRIYALAVHPQARGQRLGPRLLQDMIDSLRARGAGRIFLEVRVDNEPAVRLYESAGFRTCRVLANYYGADLAAQRMALPKEDFPRRDTKKH